MIAELQMADGDAPSGVLGTEQLGLQFGSEHDAEGVAFSESSNGRNRPLPIRIWNLQHVRGHAVDGRGARLLPRTSVLPQTMAVMPVMCGRRSSARALSSVSGRTEPSNARGRRPGGFHLARRNADEIGSNW